MKDAASAGAITCATHLHYGRLNGAISMVTENEIVIVAYVNSVDCPHCAATQMGFLNDPRGGTYECDECKKSYYVPIGARVDLG